MRELFAANADPMHGFLTMVTEIHNEQVLPGRNVADLVRTKPGTREVAFSSFDQQVGPATPPEHGKITRTLPLFLFSPTKHYC